MLTFLANAIVVSQTNLVRLKFLAQLFKLLTYFLLANHLDLGAVVWLEAYLSTYNHILVVSILPPEG